jgi:hypothetical protein
MNFFAPPALFALFETKDSSKLFVPIAANGVYWKAQSCHYRMKKA